jgi:hypothetical protein
MLRLARPLLLAAALAGPAAAQTDFAGQTAAFFGVTFLDTSTEGDINGVRPDETARIEKLEAYIAATLQENGLELVDLAPVREELERTTNPSKCNGCDVRMARELGARYSVVSEVQKVSNLIIAINLYVRDAETGAQVAGQAVDVRGNTDDTWLRGARYILLRNVFAE